MCNFSTAWENFVAHTSIKESSLKIEVYRFNAHLGPYWQNADISTIKTRDIFAFREHLRNSQLSPQSVRQCLTLLRRIMKKALQFELYAAPLPVFEMPFFDNRRTRALNQTEAQKLFEILYLKSILWHDIALFALNTGLRAGEIFTLSPRAINLEQHTATVYNTKNGWARIIPLNDTALRIAAFYCESPQAFLFFPKQVKKVSSLFRAAVQASGLNAHIVDDREKIVFHSLGHTFASWLVKNNIPILVVSHLLGHKSLQMTMRYAHLAPKQGFHAVSQLPSSIGYNSCQRKTV